MDVTLERVQFKFASIIGELCSKPMILSQFAIWVDLRLAEYKLKGSISLDCSGDKPNPDWLKGMKETEGFSDDYSNEEHHKKSSVHWHLAHNSNVTSLEQDSIAERLGTGAEDPATIVIKNDSDDEAHEIFPTGLHAHKRTNYNNTRKRSRGISGLDSGEDGLYSVIHHKVRKSPEPSVTSQTSNQSLMSIIGGQDSMHEASPVSMEDAQRDIDLAMAIQMQDSHHMGDNSSPGTYIPGRPSHATSTVTKSSQDSDSSFSSPPSKPGMWMVPPGRYSAEEAEQAGMVELLKGRGVYLYPQLLVSALGLCTSGNRSGRRSHGILRDGQPAARYLLSVFFSRDKIVNGTLSQTADHMEVLDPVIVQVITDFCLLNSDSKRSHIKQALYRKISSYRFKYKRKESSTPLVEMPDVCAIPETNLQADAAPDQHHIQH